jgi:hypothetical protein
MSSAARDVLHVMTGFVRLFYKLYFFCQTIIFFLRNKLINNISNHNFSNKQASELTYATGSTFCPTIEEPKQIIFPTVLAPSMTVEWFHDGCGAS